MSTREKYAICGIYEFGDWTAMVEYTKIPMLRKFDGSTCMVDVKSVDIKGVKRKLLLTDNGTVYKLKISRLEETVTPGFIYAVVNSKLYTIFITMLVEKFNLCSIFTLASLSLVYVQQAGNIFPINSCAG